MDNDDKAAKMDKFMKNATSHEKMKHLHELSNLLVELRCWINEALLDGKEKQMTHIKLEELYMWACKGMTKSIDAQADKEESATDE